MTKEQFLDDNEYIKKYCRDLIPVTQYDDYAICQISYSDECSDAMNYLRAIINSNEHSGMFLKVF